jgi:RecA-family ATPase
MLARDQVLQAFRTAGVDVDDEPPADHAPAPNGPEAYGLPADGEIDPGPALDQAPALATPLTLVCPPAWRGTPIPPRRWLAANRITADDAIILSGDGGAGKTTIALQLAVSVAGDLPDWLGTTCQPGAVIFFSAEEPEEEMRRRLQSAAHGRGLEPDALENLLFYFAEPDDCLLGIGRPNGPIVRTPLFDALRAAAIAVRPVLIVVDSIAATFGGNQNDRVHARTFVGLFRKLAREIDCAILLLDHPSLSGINSGTGRGGSMDWQNATRGRMYFETVTDDDDGAERVLTVKKTNYAKEGERITLRWQDGCFVPLGTAPPPARAAADAIADQAYLDCLDIVTAQGRNVFPGTGKNYAPGVFADMAEAKAKGINKRGLAAAQERLLRAGAIWNEPFGPTSRGSRRLARKRAEYGEAAE